MFYRLVFDNQTAKKNITRNLMLIAGIVLDFVAIFAIVQSVLVSSYYIVGIFVALIASIAIRYFALQIHYKIEYKLIDDKLVVSKKFSLKTVQLIDCKIAECNVLEWTGKDNFDIDLSIGSNEKYILIVNNVRYLCNMDRFLYATLLKSEE